MPQQAPSSSSTAGLGSPPVGTARRDITCRTDVIGTLPAGDVALADYADGPGVRIDHGQFRAVVLRHEACRFLNGGVHRAGERVRGYGS
jgi:hypothetical protein